MSGGMIVDCNVLFGFWPLRRLESDLASVKSETSSHGIAKSLVCSMRGIFTDFTEGNQETLRVCASDPSLEPVATLNPRRWIGLKEEIERCLDQGVKVFRFFPEYQNWPYRFLPFDRTLELLAGSGALVICPIRVGGHQNSGVLTEFAERIRGLDLRFLITGVHYWTLAEAIAVTQANENIFLETHLLNSPDAYEILVEEVGAKRLMYGSASPFHHINSSLLPLRQSTIKVHDQDLILQGNIARELGWDSCK